MNLIPHVRYANRRVRCIYCQNLYYREFINPCSKMCDSCYCIKMYRFCHNCGIVTQNNISSGYNLFKIFCTKEQCIEKLWKEYDGETNDTIRKSYTIRIGRPHAKIIHAIIIHKAEFISKPKQDITIKGSNNIVECNNNIIEGSKSLDDFMFEELFS